MARAVNVKLLLASRLRVLCRDRGMPGPKRYSASAHSDSSRREYSPEAYNSK